MNNIGEAPQPGGPSLLDRFPHHHRWSGTNPLRNLGFDRSIDQAVSEHLSQSHVSPFTRAQLRTEYAKNFYLQFFLGLLSAARLKPGNTITKAYYRESTDTWNMLIVQDKEYVRMHTIYVGKLSTDQPEETFKPTKLRELAAFMFDVERLEQRTDETISMQEIKNFEYELIPRSTASDGKFGLELKLLNNVLLKRSDVVSLAHNNFLEYRRQRDIRELHEDIESTFGDIFVKDQEVTYEEFSYFSSIALEVMHSITWPDRMPELEMRMSIAGHLHSILLSAVPNDYYNKIMSSPVPHVYFEDGALALHLPPMMDNPNTHLVIDTQFQNINPHIGYMLFDHLSYISPETKIIETKYIQDHDLELPLRARTLQLTVENLIENLYTDLVDAAPIEADHIRINMQHYSHVLKKILEYGRTKSEIRSVNDLKYFLLGSLRARQDIGVEVLQNEGVVEKLHMKDSDFLYPTNIILDFKEGGTTESTLEDLIEEHRMGRVLSVKFKYENRRFTLQLAFTSPEYDVEGLNHFQTLSSTSLMSALHVTDAVTKETLQEEMETFFKDMKETVPKDSLAVYVAGVFQKMQIRLINFHSSVTDGVCSIRAEIMVDGQKRTFYMEMFESHSTTAAERALRFRQMAEEKKSIIVTYNMLNEQDGLAVMAADDQERHLNTDNVEAMCRPAARKRRANAFGFCGYDGEKVGRKEDKISYEEIEKMTAEKFPNLKADLAVLHELTGKLQLAFLARDLVGAAYQKDWNSVMHSALFFGTAMASSKVGSSIEEWGIRRAAAGERLLGGSARAVGLCLPKIGFDIYMGLQLKDELDNNDTESAAYTGAYIGLDIGECAVEALEALGVISSGGIASPILAILGASVLVAQNAMQTARRMKQITAILPLTADEKVYEITREFLHFGTDDVIQSMIDKIIANEVAALQTLKQYPRFGRYLISAAAKATENDLIFIDDNIIDVTRTHYFNKSRLMPRDDVLGNGVTVFCALDEALNPGREELTSAVAKTDINLRYISLGSSMAGEMKLPQYKPYTNPRTDSYCENAFGILNKNNTDSSETLYLLFNGTDNVVAYPGSANVFLLMNSNKSINGGLKNDHFFIQAQYIYGYLNGSAGEDVVDFSASEAGKDLVIKNGQAFFSPMLNNTHVLNLYHIESIVGRNSLSDYIEVCNETKVDLGGATFGMDRIILTNSCARTTKRNVSIILRKNTFIKCDTPDLVRYIATNDSETDLVLQAGQHHFEIDSLDFKDVAINGGKELWTVNLANVSLIRIRTDDWSNISFLFKKQNLLMNFDGQNRTLYLQGDNEIFDVVENYADYVENNLNIKLIAHSQQGMIVLNHNLFMVDFEGKNRLLNVVSNGHKSNVQLVGHSSVENYFLIRWVGLVEDAGDFNVTIHPRTSDSMPCYIDLHDLTKNIHLITHGDYGLFVIPERIADDIKLHISAHNNRDSSIVEEYLGEVNIIGGYKILNQITVYLHAKNVFSDNHGILNLQSPVIHVNSSVLTILPGQVEFYSSIHFNHSTKNLRPYRMGNSTLLLSNFFPMKEANQGYPLTISLVDYFDFQAKYQTLSLAFDDEVLNLAALADNAEDMKFLWMDIVNGLNGPNDA